MILPFMATIILYGNEWVCKIFQSMCVNEMMYSTNVPFLNPLQLFISWYPHHSTYYKAMDGL